ncbi:MAG: restriction endonuclease subunit S [Bacteroidetes bacterium]|nr:restriction endonuclease subunit S [Bacteroidota bacterium]
MSEWKEYKLGEVTTKIGSGATPTGGSNAYKLEGISLIRSQNVLDFKFSYDGLAFIDDEQADSLKNVIIEESDVLLNITGDSVARVCKVPKVVLPARVNQHVAIIRADKTKTNSDFILYYLQSIKEYLLMYSEIGGTRNALTKAMIENLTILLPPLPIQTAIAEILSSLDDKIDLLHQNNKTLEALAETIFRKWFVEDAEESWEVDTLDKLINTVNGLSYKSSELNSSKVAMVSLKSFDRTGGFRLDGFKEYIGKYKEQQIVIEGDLIVAHTDITQEAEVIGRPALVIGNTDYDTMVISMDMVKVVPKFDWVSIEFLYFLMRTKEFKGHCEGHANGSTVLHLSKLAIPTFEFQVPEKEKVVEFTTYTKELVKKIFVNHSQIKTLTQLRDTLLPKLMSGEISLNYDF